MAEITVENEEAMLALGERFAQCCPKKCVMYLEGDLGAGKTTLARGILRGLGYTERVKSPTYTLVESYTLPERIVHHFDLYRIESADAVRDMGIDDYAAADAVLLIEWPEHAKGCLPSADIHCQLRYDASAGRVLAFQAMNDNAAQLLKRWLGKTTP